MHGSSGNCDERAWLIAETQNIMYKNITVRHYNVRYLTQSSDGHDHINNNNNNNNININNSSARICP